MTILILVLLIILLIRIYYELRVATSKLPKDVFRYYYFVDAQNEEEFNDYVENCKKVSIYDIETTATYGEQLLTLSTCEYSRENGRFAVVAKKK